MREKETGERQRGRERKKRRQRTTAGAGSGGKRAGVRLELGNSCIRISAAVTKECESHQQPLS